MLNAFDLVNAKSALDKRYRANSAQRPRLVSTETSLRNALAVVAARHQSAKDLAVFLDAPSPDTPNPIPISHGKIVAQLGVALRDLVMAEGSMEWVLALEGEDALLVLDALQLFLDHAPRKDRFRQSATHIIIKLAARSNQLPSSLFVEDVTLAQHRQSLCGGFADVYQGFRNSELVAVKKMRSIGGDQAAYKSLCREALVWRHLKHPNVLPLIGLSRDLFPLDVFPCLISPWMQHGMLKDYISTPHFDRAMELPSLLLGICEGLEYLHSVDVIHGDISNMNILIDDAFCAVLADFGLVLLDECTVGGFTATKNGFNPRWTSPQRLEGSVRAKSDDIYSFGCIFYYLYSGLVPFEKLAELPAVIQVMTGKRPAHPTEAASQYPPSRCKRIWDMITICWTQDARFRPTAGRVRELLNQAFSDSEDLDCLAPPSSVALNYDHLHLSSSDTSLYFTPDSRPLSNSSPLRQVSGAQALRPRLIQCTC